MTRGVKKPETILLDHKMLVLYKLLKYEVLTGQRGTTISDLDHMSIDDWNPQDNNKATFNEWDEIFEAMDGELLDRYQDNIFALLGYGQGATKMWWKLHTAKPAIRWKALIKTLEAI